MRKYRAAGRILKCTHCEFEGFECSRVQLNTAFLTFLDLDWLNPNARVFNCQKCGKLQWFGENAEIVELDDFGEDGAIGDADCLACGEVIETGSIRCNKCGWSYSNT